MKLSTQTYNVVSASSTEPVSVEEVKSAMRINCDDDDTFIEGLITAAREMVETATSRDLITKSYEMYMDKLDMGAWLSNTYLVTSIVELIKVPVTDITKIEYIDADTTDGTYTDLDDTNYQSDIISQPARIYIENVPNYKTNTLNAIKISFTSGYTSSNIPKPLTQAIMLIVGHWYENRQDVVTGTQVNTIPETSKWLIDRYRLQLFR